MYTKGILYAKVCTRLNHLGANIEKSPHPPPARSLRSLGLGRFAPSQSRNLFRNFLFEMLGGLVKCLVNCTMPKPMVLSGFQFSEHTASILSMKERLFALAVNPIVNRKERGSFYNLN